MDAGLAAIEAYIREANRLSRQAFVALRTGRLDLAEECTAAAALLRKAAKAERVNPPVETWNP